MHKIGLPWWLSGKESACQHRRRRFDQWFGRITRAMEQLRPRAATMKPVLYSLGAATTEACALQSPCSATREATAMKSARTTTRVAPTPRY